MNILVKIWPRPFRPIVRPTTIEIRLSICKASKIIGLRFLVSRSNLRRRIRICSQNCIKVHSDNDECTFYAFRNVPLYYKKNSEPSGLKSDIVIGFGVADNL